MKQNMVKTFLLLIAGFTMATAHAQSTGNDQVLFTVAGQPVTKEEFLYVYKKNNPDKQNDYSRESLQEYLDLYVNFKLKVTEARAEKIDTTEKVREELQKYGDQLIKSNFDKEVLEQAAQKLYADMQTERLVYHIMIAVDFKKAGVDTMAAINKLNQAKERLLKGESFAKVAKEVSTDQSNTTDPGLIGWFLKGQINSEIFDKTIFSMPVGSYSDIIKTSLGYHIVYVPKSRPNQGTTTVSHILVRTGKDAKPEAIAQAKKKADSLYAVVKAGGSTFEEIATKYSDDKTSAAKGGLLDAFTTGKMIYAFQETAYSLKNPGDISAPVQTTYGWHIIKLIEHQPLDSFDEMKGELKTSIEKSPEYKNIRAEFVANAKSRYSFTENADAKKELLGKLDSAFVKSTWNMHQADGLTKVLFTIGNKSYTQTDMASYLEINQRVYRDKSIEEKYNKLYNQAVEQAVIEYDLSERNVDFRRLLQEYRDGLPLFAMLERKIWSRGSTDTVGLRNYYEMHKTEYMWDERVEATTYICKDAKTAKAVRKMAGKNAGDKEIMAKFNKDSVELVFVKTAIYLPGQDSNVDNLNKTPGIGADILNADGTITFVKLTKVIPPTPKSLDEARGYVISAYQDQLEKEWIEELHKKYPVAIDQKVFNSMVR